MGAANGSTLKPSKNEYQSSRFISKHNWDKAKTELQQARITRFPAEKFGTEANGKYDGHDIKIKANDGVNITFYYCNSGDVPEGKKRTSEVPIDAKLKTLDGDHNGGMTAEQLAGRRRL